MGRKIISRNNWRLDNPSAGARRLICALILFAAVTLTPMASSQADDAEHVLTATGADLGSLYTTGKIDDLRFTVNLNGDEPSASYVWVIIGSNDYRVRTNEGYWLPWNRQNESLIDNQVPVIDGKMVFKVLDQDIGKDNHGINIRIGYKVGEVLKYGGFAILPKTGGD